MILVKDVGNATVSKFEGSLVDLLFEASQVLKGLRESFVKEYSEDTTNKLISLIGLMSLAETDEDKKDCAEKLKKIIVDDAIEYARRETNGNKY